MPRIKTTSGAPFCGPWWSGEIALTLVELFLAVEAGLGGRRAALDPQAGRDHDAAAAAGGAGGDIGRGAHGIAGCRHHGCGGYGGPGRAVQVRDGDVVRRDGAGRNDGKLDYAFGRAENLWG